MDDVERLKHHYAERAAGGLRYHYSQADVALGSAEVDALTLRALRDAGLTDFENTRVLEIGSGSGSNLLRMVRWGFQPQNLTGCELLTDRHDHALSVVPPGVRLINADARTLGEDASFDIVVQATVLSSILDDTVQQEVASTMWDALKPGGVILSFDFTVNNPANDQVRGVTKARLAELFPGEVRARRVVLAPPIARRVGWHPGVHLALRAVPWLRTHMLAVIRKER